MRRLRVRRVAKAEIRSAFEWYRKQSPVVAERFLEAVDAAFAAIEAGPERVDLTGSRLKLGGGSSHSVFVNVALRKVSTVPRHREIKDFLAKRICKDLKIPAV